MLKRFTAVLISAVMIAAAFAGCSKKGSAPGSGTKDFPVAIGNVTIQSEPEGAAVLSPNIASVILALGYETQLKAKSADCTQSDLSVLPNVTANDADKIKSLGATLVFADADLTAAQNDAMKNDGITVLVVSPATSRTDLTRLYSNVGAALKGAVTGAAKGETMADGVFQTIDDITRMVPQSNTPITAAYLSDAKDGAATGDTLGGALVEAAGLTNVADSATGGKMNLSDLKLANPQYIFCPKGVKAELAASSDLKGLDAVKNGHVYEMDPGLMKLQGEELVDAVSFMAGTVYPELLGSSSSSPAGGTSSSPANSGAGNTSSGTGTSSGSTAAPINLNQTLQKGMQSNDVLQLQKRLQELGYMFVTPSGLFADGTEQSVKDFQYLNGITVTGIADPATLQKIFSAGAVKRTTP